MKQYNEKEIGIFTGVIKLLKQGKMMNELKASEIAEASGIGKGTLYDYFSSKDEILIHTLLYSMQQELNKCEEISLNKSFLNQTECILRQIGKESGNFLAVKELMLEKREWDKTSLEMYSEILPDFLEVKVKLKSILDDYIHKGMNEKIITAENEDYIKNTVLMLFMGFIAFQKCSQFNKQDENRLTEQIETVKMILVKSLHG